LPFGAGDSGFAFTTRLGGVLSTFSLDRVAGPGRDAPRMLWSRPIGATTAGAKFERDGWSFGISAGYGGDELGSAGTASAMLQPGNATRRNGWSAGLEYDFGPWQLGGYYQYARSDIGFTPASQIESGYGLGANYTLAPGMRLFSEAFFYSDIGGRSSAAGGAGSNATNLKPQSGQLYVVGTHLEW
jgi:predicted porin